MHIGIIIGRIGGVDGVALETEKWIHVLQKMGHTIHLLSGEYERPVDLKYTAHLPLLSFFSKECLWEQDNAFYHSASKPAIFLREVEKNADFVAAFVKTWVKKQRIQVLLSENASSLPSHLSMGWGIKKAVEALGLAIITHDHDFAWERGERYQSKHVVINRFVAETFPLQLPEARHAVINSNAQKVLKERFSAEAVVVPNVMDFDHPFTQKQWGEKTFRRDTRLQPDDIILMQVTRIVPRKSIETAIELLNRLNDKHLKLLITGTEKDDHDRVYYKKIQELIRRYSLADQVRFIGDIVRHCTSFISNQNICPTHEGGNRIYSLSEIYTFARACTYFSTYEGFGNAFVEAVAARKPIFVNNYQPVFWPDIGSRGFKTVMLENNQLTEKAVDQIRDIIFDEQECQKIAEHNFVIGKKYFSYDTLDKKLDTLLRV